MGKNIIIYICIAFIFLVSVFLFIGCKTQHKELLNTELAAEEIVETIKETTVIEKDISEEKEEEISTEIEDSRVEGEWEISSKTEQGTNAESFTIEFNFEDYENNSEKGVVEVLGQDSSNGNYKITNNKDVIFSYRITITEDSN